ncbi:MAG: hypothetical protein GF313_16935 [Caldithrix sp.]|nr:hypothetical protein [Caldithrix sp.]
MGKSRDDLIRRLGGKPVSELDLTETELMEMAWDTYVQRGELPPALRNIIEDLESNDPASGQSLTSEFRKQKITQELNNGKEQK